MCLCVTIVLELALISYTAIDISQLGGSNFSFLLFCITAVNEE